MFGSTRGRMPLALPFFFVLGLATFALVGSAGAAVGAALVLPFLILKVFFLFFLIRMMFGVVRGGAPWGGSRHRGRWAPPAEPTEEEREKAEARRAAQEEVDSLFPDL